MNTDVLVVGAGPTGMMLAHELVLAGAAVEVVDRLPERSGLSRAGAVLARTLESLDQRGLLEPLLATGDFPSQGGHFAGLPINPGLIAGRHPGRFIPQTALEAFLEARLAELGVVIHRAHELVDFTQDESGVTAHLRHGATTSSVRASYLVGTDGGHSTVRAKLGIGFPGRAGTDTTVIADVRLGGAEKPTADAGRQGSAWTWAPDGQWAGLFPLRPGLQRVTLGGPDGPGREVPITEEEVQARMRSVFGPKLDLIELGYAFRIDNAARQVERYRHGRVFLAGDAAHIHLPVGGQGMNTGIQDAVNLGWKLGAAVGRRGEAEELLESYHAERHPVAASVLRNVQAQSALMGWTGTRDPDRTALREFFTTLASRPEIQRELGTIMSGLDITYPIPGTRPHPLLGRRIPDFDLPASSSAAPGSALPRSATRLHELLRSAHGLLLDPGTDPLAAELAARWSGLVDLVPWHAAPATVLVRPDGYVCFATDGPVDEAELSHALTRWFGQARVPSLR
jgi:2-polyprenyl-6-methoxyphenol hydroxylase-like FAD-dependent oxidoreductase